MIDRMKIYRDPSHETWRIFRILSEFVEGFDTMSQVGAAVCIFGSARAPRESKSYQNAELMAAAFARKGFAILTGGGPGVMEAANKGAFEAGGMSVGLNITLPQEQMANSYHNVSLEFEHFFPRKVMFFKYAVALVCFPGGFGTMDEFFEAMTLIQTGKSPAYPVVLFDSAFWGPMIEFMRGMMLEGYGSISPQDLDLFKLTDDVDEAVNYIAQNVERLLPSMQHLDSAAEASLPRSNRITGEGTRYGVSPRRYRFE